MDVGSVGIVAEDTAAAGMVERMADTAAAVAAAAGIVVLDTVVAEDIAVIGMAVEVGDTEGMLGIAAAVIVAGSAEQGEAVVVVAAPLAVVKQGPA